MNQERIMIAIRKCTESFALYELGETFYLKLLFSTFYKYNPLKKLEIYDWFELEFVFDRGLGLSTFVWSWYEILG